MIFNNHYNLEGKHALLGASQNSWLRKSDDELLEYFYNIEAKERGTRLHALAAEHIELGLKMPKNDITINRYINDAIGYKMTPEQVLYYSQYCFGTADAISFRRNVLRIHDLKTGRIPAHVEQLEVYAALFCLEYGIKPGDIDIYLAIYQNNEIFEEEPTAEDILPIMDKIVHFDKLLSSINNEEN